MSRRRPSFRAYLRRRWRAVGLVLVLLAGALLVLVVTDRGHDPLWEARGGSFSEAVPAPDGGIVYALKRDGGSIVGLEARSGRDGTLLWGSPLTANRALLRAGDEGVAVATDFPLAFLTLYRPDGSVRFQVAIDGGSPRAMAVEGGVVALALESPARANPVLVVEEGKVRRTHEFDGIVNAVDLRGGVLAVGTAAGEVGAFSSDGSPLLRETIPYNVRSLRLTEGGAGLAAGGSGRAPDLTGFVAFYEMGDDATRRWLRPTASGVALVDADAGGTRVLSVEESPPRYTLRVHDAAEGVALWARVLDGIVAHDGAGAFGGAALSPDGSTAAAATVRGGIEAYDATRGRLSWRYGSEGSTLLVFARDANHLLVANARLVSSGPHALLLFSSEAEPPTGRIAFVGATLILLAAFSTAAGLGWGYWRVRRTY